EEGRAAGRALPRGDEDVHVPVREAGRGGGDHSGEGAEVGAVTVRPVDDDIGRPAGVERDGVPGAVAVGVVNADLAFRADDRERRRRGGGGRRAVHAHGVLEEGVEIVQAAGRGGAGAGGVLHQLHAVG